MQTKTAEKESPFTTLTFPNINPVNTAEEGIRVGHYDDCDPFITNETVPLQPVQGAKDLHLVSFNRIIGETESVELLRAEGKRPCQNAPQYLLGLMAAVPEERMPQELRNKKLLAAEPDNKSSVFSDENGYRCFLCIFRDGGGRELSLAIVDGEWSGFCAFLAEDL